MFKQIQVYNIGAQCQLNVAAIETALAEAKFLECGAAQEKSVGWVPPRGEAHGALVEVVGGQWLLKLMVEVKVIPGSVVKRRVKEQVEQITATTGRKPGKKETRDLRDDARNALLPLAFAKQSAVQVWIDPVAHRLVIDAGSKARSDEVMTMLVKAIDGFAVSLVNTTQSPAASMSIWLTTQELPAKFTADRDCTLKASDESKASVRYAKHALDIEEISAHIAAGKVPTQLAMTWNDRVSFILTDSLHIKKIEFLDLVFSSERDGDASSFDTDVAIFTKEFENLIPDLFEALGGVVAQQANQ